MARFDVYPDITRKQFKALQISIDKLIGEY